MALSVDSAEATPTVPNCVLPASSAGGGCPDLLLAMARQDVGAVGGPAPEILARVRDWGLLLRIAQEHRVFPMLAAYLGESQSGLPAFVQERLRAEYKRNALHSLANSAELVEVLGEFRREGIRAMPFKGVVLAASVYHDLGRRPAGDLDLLIHHRDLRRATEIIRQRGYHLVNEVHSDGTPVIPHYYEYHFERQSDGRILELRWKLELVYSKFRRDLGIEWIWARRRSLILAGAEVPDISPELKLLVLCMHGSKHAWSRLLWICDVAQLLKTSERLDWSEVAREAGRSGLRRSLALGVLLAHEIGGAPVPPSVLKRFQSDGTATALAKHFRENLFKTPGRGPAGSVPYNVQLLDFGDRLRFFLSLNSLKPNERDQAAFPLPKPLRGLHYLLRPVRILMDRSAR